MHRRFARSAEIASLTSFRTWERSSSRQWRARRATIAPCDREPGSVRMWLAVTVNPASSITCDNSPTGQKYAVVTAWSNGARRGPSKNPTTRLPSGRRHARTLRTRPRSGRVRRG